MLDALWIDVRHSVRHFLGSPGFALAAISTVALTIGANVTALSLLNATLLRTIAVVSPDQLVSITVADTRTNQAGYIARETFDAFRSEQASFSTLSMYSGGGAYRLEARGAAVDVGVEGVMPEYFDLVGSRLTVGGFFTARDNDPNGADVIVAVITDRLWRRIFSAESRTVGERIKIDGKVATIIGVTSPGFVGLQLDSGADIFLPLPFVRGLAGDRKGSLRSPAIVGRLAPGVSVERARAEVSARWPAIRDATAAPRSSLQQSNLSQRVVVESLATGFSTLRRQWGPSFEAVVGLTVVLLAIGCVNLMGLLSARVSARRQEVAVCLALGASRTRVVQRFLVEGLLLAMLGLSAAIPTAWWSSQALTALFTFARAVPLQRPMTPDGRVVAIAIAAAFVIGVLVGVWPAWRAANGRASDSVRGGRTIPSTIGRFGRFVLITQIAFSMMLLVGAGLFVGMLSSLHTNHAQFRTQNILWTQLARNPDDHGTRLSQPYFQGLIGQLTAIPGVESSAMSYMFPAYLGYRGPLPVDTFTLEGKAETLPITALSEFVSPGFFKTFDIPSLSGRDFLWSDDERAPAVVIVSATLADKLSPGGNAVGRHLRTTVGTVNTSLEIVGVVGDAPIGSIREPHSAVAFRPMMQDIARAQSPLTHVRVNGDVKVVAEAYRRVVESQGHHVIRALFTLSDWIDNALLQERLIAWVSTSAAILAVLLSCIGIYAALAYAVTLRVREIGVRMALGASRATVIWLIVRDGFQIAIPGVLIGIPCALAAAQLVRSQLYGVKPSDPWTIIGASTTFLLVGIASALIPALSASRIDAADALRQG